MKKNKLFSLAAVSLSVLLFTGCAAIQDGLNQMNGALSDINSTLTGSNYGGQSIPDKSTAVYSLQNMKIKETSFADGKGVVLEGEAYNKTAKQVRLVISIPVVDKKGFSSGYLTGEVFLPPKGKTKIDIAQNHAMPEGGKLEINKFNVHQDSF